MADDYPTRFDCPMPTSPDQERADLLLARQSLLDDNCVDVTRRFMIAKTGDEKGAILGLPDTSANPVISAGRQLSTPGLYGVPPRIRHADPAAAPLLDQIALSGWLPRMQHTQLMAWGLGEWFLRFDIPSSVGHLTVRAVSPVDVYVECDPDLPDVPVILWERRCRRGPDGKWAWFWDRYDIGARAPSGEWLRPASYSVVGAIAKGGVYEDFSAFFLPGAPIGGFIGDAYPYIADGAAFLPWAVYRAVDTGRAWNHDHNRGLTVGALNAMVYWTYVGYAALGATGRVVIAVNLDFGASVQEAPRDQTQTARVRTIPLTPGSILTASAKEGAGTVLIQEVGPGADLEVLAEFAQGYELAQYVRAGLNPADVTRTAANPTSGSALAISDKGRREYADRIRPLFERVDQQSIAIIAKLMRIVGLGQPPISGYTIEYHGIPETPAEATTRRANREADITAGRLSPIDAYMDEHPGLSREAAEQALVQIAVDGKRLAKRITDAAIAAGLEEQAQPTGDATPAQDVALNGAQIASLLLIIDSIAAGKFTRNGAIATITTSFPTMSPDEAGALFDGVLTPPAPIAA